MVMSDKSGFVVNSSSTNHVLANGLRVDESGFLEPNWSHGTVLGQLFFSQILCSGDFCWLNVIGGYNVKRT